MPDLQPSIVKNEPLVDLLPSETSSTLTELTPVQTQRRNVSSACTACQQSRSKCTGDKPCKRCTLAKLECHYTTTSDGRRKESRKRKFEDLENDSRLLTYLIEALQASNDLEIMHIVSLIRVAAPISEVKMQLQEQITTNHRFGQQNSPELTNLHQRVKNVTASGVWTSSPEEANGSNTSHTFHSIQRTNQTLRHSHRQ